MPHIPIIMPQLGESIAEANIVAFLVKPGDTVEADQNLIEVETNKATMTVTSPCSGRIEKFTAELNESYTVGAVLGHIEATTAYGVMLMSGQAGPVDYAGAITFFRKAVAMDDLV